jgi:hypothetical protein
MDGHTHNATAHDTTNDTTYNPRSPDAQAEKTVKKVVGGLAVYMGIRCGTSNLPIRNSVHFMKA